MKCLRCVFKRDDERMWFKEDLKCPKEIHFNLQWTYSLALVEVGRSFQYFFFFFFLSQKGGMSKLGWVITRSHYQESHADNINIKSAGQGLAGLQSMDKPWPETMSKWSLLQSCMAGFGFEMNQPGLSAEGERDVSNIQESRKLKTRLSAAFFGEL